MKPTTKSLLLLLFATNCCASIQKRDGEEDKLLDTLDELIAETNDFTPNDMESFADENGRHLNPSDFNAVEDLTRDIPSGDEDPIEQGEFFEGDIVHLSFTRNAIKNKYQLWPNNVVPYTMSSQYSKHERSVIASAFQEYHAKTCIKFVPRTNQRDYIHIMKGSGCFSSVGRVGGRQQVSLGRGCVYKGIVEHELMHALGFWHEQSRADRDDNVYIRWENINPSMKYNFNKYTLKQVQHLNAPYDTCSVMHYSGTAFSRNGRKTIEKKPGKGGNCRLGQRNGFSDLDVKKINTLYSCQGYPTTTGGAVTKPKPTTTPTVKPDTTCQDTNKYCATWAKNDECQINPGWMLKNCPVACDECSNQCADHEEHCTLWKKQGECKKNPEYMNIYCAKSCGVCKGKSCEDENKFCGDWAKNGYCKSKKFKGYMTLRCKKSCGHC